MRHRALAVTLVGLAAMGAVGQVVGAPKPGKTTVPSRRLIGAPKPRGPASEWRWHKVASWPRCARGERVQALDFDGKLGVAATSEGRIFVSRDAARTWAQADTGALGMDGVGLYACLARGNRLIVAGHRRIIVSDDTGSSWRESRLLEVPTGPGYSDDWTIYDLDADPRDPRYVMAVGDTPEFELRGSSGGISYTRTIDARGFVLTSADRGDSFTWRGGPIEANQLRGVCWSSGGRAFVCGWGGWRMAWRSTDGGEEWTPSLREEDGLGRCTECVGDYVWVGATLGTVWRSDNNGEAWRHFVFPGGRGAVQALAFLSQSVGVMVTERQATSRVLHTTDATRYYAPTWTPGELPPGRWWALSCAAVCRGGPYPFLVGGAWGDYPAVLGASVPPGVMPQEATLAAPRRALDRPTPPQRRK